jgi:signal transduction histidine kinase
MTIVVRSLILSRVTMPVLLATLLSLPDDRRASVERELVELTRSATLGELAGDVGHDAANALFGGIGLVDLLLQDATPGSEEESRLQLLQTTLLELRTILRTLLDYARVPGEEEAHAELDAAARSAVELVRHGIGRSLQIDERYPPRPEVVACGPAALAQAVLHLLLAARGAGHVALEVSPGCVRVSPVPESSLDAVVAERIAVDNGGASEREGDWLSLRWTG